MVSRSKLYTRLDALEAELEERLVPHLKQAAEGMNDLVFCAEGYNLCPQLKHSTDQRTEELIGIGAQILSLRVKLNEPSESTLAERICWYCHKWADINDHRRSSAQVLARQFLNEIEHEK